MVERSEVRCPRCGATLTVSGDVGGPALTCPDCGGALRVPPAESAASGPGVPAAARPTIDLVSSVPARPVPQPAAMPSVIRANRPLAGTPCPACGREVLLGEEVVRCPDCGGVSHSGCWQQRGGCAAPTCAPAPAAPGAILVAAAVKVCPACAENIPADAVVCPYCSESLTGPGVGVAVPTTFKAPTGGVFARTWHFTNAGDELIAQLPRKGKEIRVRREEAPHAVVLTKRRLIITVDGKRTKFNIGDIGHVATAYWLTGRVTPRTSSVAKDALVSAIVGIFLFQIILGIWALVQAGRARNLIDQYPGALRGRDLATAATVIGILDLCIFAVLVLGQAGRTM